MGVHDLNKYDEVRSALGIPEGEPLFIIRAQDRLSVEMIDAYRRVYKQQMLIAGTTPDEIFVKDLGNTIRDFLDWQEDNDEKVKFPD